MQIKAEILIENYSCVVMYEETGEKNLLESVYTI